MHLERIKLIQFKNYEGEELFFNPAVNCIVGQNGMGKTNLLDAIYYLCMGKSYFGLSDSFIVQQGTGFFRLEGDLMRDDRIEKVVAKIEPRKRKEFERNKVLYQRLSEHVGRYPVVIIVPDDTQLVTEGSEVRRRLLDNTLSQLDEAYLRALILYNKLLKQRNALLKQAEGRMLSEDLLLVYDEQMVKPATYIHERRQALIAAYAPIFQEAQRAISGEGEQVGLRYKSGLAEDDLLSLLKESREKDRILERTTVGIHKDDLVFTQEDRPLKRMASQGQLKTFVLALKLAQYRFLKQEKGVKPLLLLDDIFDKLDPSRVQQLIQYILAEDFGQVFLSDTDPNRVQQVISGQAVEYSTFQIESGQASKL